MSTRPGYPDPGSSERASVDVSPFHQRLKTLIRTWADEKSYDAIDMVCLKGTGYYLPNETTWKALDGLKPKHLEIVGGWDEECNMKPLDGLQQKWDLETLTLAGLAGTTRVPSAFCGLKTLTMDYCSGFEFNPPGQLNTLRHLTITGNDNLDMFTALCKFNPAVPGFLQTLDLQCGPRIGNYELKQFKQSLAQCTALLRLRLVLGGPGKINPYLGAVRILPSSVEHLTYRGIPAMSRDLPQWVKSATDPTWLPHLKTISFGFNVSPARPSSLDAAEMMTISTQVEEFLDTLASHRPNIQILDDF